jgi:hypothetical protein
MSDVNDNAEAGVPAQAEIETAAPQSQEGEQTAEGVSEPAKPIERTIPYSRFAEVNKGYKDLQRKLAEFEQKSKLSQYTDEDASAVMAHPYTQELAIKVAKYELTDFARGALDAHPEIPEQVKKAMLQNIRGFVKESTTDVESAKVDIQDYIDSLVEQMPTQQQPKVIPVATTKAQETSSNTRPLDIQNILDKPVDEWSDDEAKTVEQYKKTQPKRQ